MYVLLKRQPCNELTGSKPNSASFINLYEMTTSVRFYLSFDSLKWDVITFQMTIISITKRIADMNIVNGVTCYVPKCYYTCGHMIFMT